MFWDSLADVASGGVTAVAAYATLLLVLRSSGKRTLAQLNAFDLIVTVALGSTLSSVILASETSWSEGAVAFVVLCLAQYLVAWSSVRIGVLRDLVKSEPRLLVRDGEILHEALRAERLTVGEVRQAVRSQGSGSVRDVSAVVLETDGTLSVIPASRSGAGDALHDVPGAADVRSTSP